MFEMRIPPKPLLQPLWWCSFVGVLATAFAAALRRLLWLINSFRFDFLCFVFCCCCCCCIVNCSALCDLKLYENSQEVSFSEYSNLMWAMTPLWWRLRSACPIRCDNMQCLLIDWFPMAKIPLCILRKFADSVIRFVQCYPKNFIGDDMAQGVKLFSTVFPVRTN